MIRIFTILLILLFSVNILADSSFKAAKKKKEIELKLKAEKRKKDEAQKKALEKLEQMKKQKLDLYYLTDQDLESIEKKENEINKKNSQQIKILERMIKNPSLSNNQKADRMFRLAEAKWESSKYAYLRKRKEYENIIDKCSEDKSIKCPEEPIADYSASIKLYKEILKKIPQYERIDEVIYYLGHGLQRAGKPSQAVSYFKKIVLKYKNSSYLHIR